MRGAMAQIQNTNVHTPMQRAEQFQELKICVSPQFRAIDPPNPTRGFIRQNQTARFATAACRPKCQNACFATAACTKMYETSAWRRQSPATYKKHRFTTVSNVRPARSDERVPRRAQKFAFHHSFGRPTSTKWRKGCASAQQICMHFTTVLGVRRSLFVWRCSASSKFHHSFERPTITFCVKGCSATWQICISPQFWASDEYEVTRGLSPAVSYQTYPAEKKKTF